ncbi:MAG TPA: hypothetical protein VHJ83_04640 [Micromonosporaceae bacterium]|nr:hypothetical protein [Micromonosporaceae bacterium]
MPAKPDPSLHSVVVQAPGNSRRVWRPRTGTRPAEQWIDRQPDDAWTGQRPPTVVPGWGEDAQPRSRRSIPEPPRAPTAPPVPDAGYGQQPSPAGEPTWASRALNLGAQPATVPGWGQTGEPTWVGSPPPAAPYEPVSRQASLYSTASHPIAQPPVQDTRGYPTGGYPATPTTYHERSPAPQPQGRPYRPEPDLGYGAEPASGGTRTAVVERPSQQEEESWRERAAKAATPFKRRKGGAGKRTGRASAFLSILLTLCLIAAAGYWFWSSQQGRSASGDPYFETLSVSGLIDRITEDGFECIPGRSIAQCEKQIPGADLSITLHFAAETEVTRIEASGGTEAYSEEAATPGQLAEFFGMAAGLPFPDDAGVGDKAKAWSAQNVGRSGAQTFDGVRYESAGDQQLLTMHPAE